MTFEGEFIQNEGARQVMIGIIVFLVLNLLPMTMIPFQYEKDGGSQDISKIENELTFSGPL
jgi:hypothetical protein